MKETLASDGPSACVVASKVVDGVGDSTGSAFAVACRNASGHDGTGNFTGSESPQPKPVSPARCLCLEPL